MSMWPHVHISMCILTTYYTLLKSITIIFIYNLLILIYPNLAKIFYSYYWESWYLYYVFFALMLFINLIAILYFFLIYTLPLFDIVSLWHSLLFKVALKRLCRFFSFKICYGLTNAYFEILIFFFLIKLRLMALIGMKFFILRILSN